MGVRKNGGLSKTKRNSATTNRNWIDGNRRDGEFVNLSAVYYPSWKPCFSLKANQRARTITLPRQKNQLLELFGFRKYPGAKRDLPKWNFHED
jgi:hypothetical protein